MKAYAVIETQYEYDDDRYNPQGYEPPTKLYRTREKCEEILQAKLKDHFSQHTLDFFGYDTDEVISQKGQEILMSLLPMLTIHGDWDPGDIDPEKVSLDVLSRLFKTAVEQVDWLQLSDLLREIYVHPFRVIELEVVD